jgi:hypothetical protein
MKAVLSGQLFFFIALLFACAYPGICMGTNEQIIKDVTALAEQFDEKPDAELLRNAYQKLEGVRLHTEIRLENKLRMRAATSALWIRMLNRIDTYLPADFDPENAPGMQPTLPPAKSGQSYPPGTDPQTIRDPQDRSAYIKAITDHRNSQERYRLQMHLYRLNEQLTESARNYFVLAYQGTPQEQQELKMILQNGIKREDRKAEFLKFVRQVK